MGSEEEEFWRGFDWNSRKEAGEDAEEEEGGIAVGAEREVGENIGAGRGSERIWLCTAIIWEGFGQVREEGPAAPALPGAAFHSFRIPPGKRPRP